MSERTNQEQSDQGGKWRFQRRGLLRLAAVGAGASAITTLLAACGGTTPTATSAPRPSTAASTAASAAPASAAASTGGTASAAPASAAPASAAAASAPAASAAASGAASAAPASAAAGGATGGQVSYHWVKPVTLHPLFSTSGAEQGVARLLFGALVKVNDKLEAVPDIAEKIDVSADAKVYTFNLKKTLVFTDGKPLTAADVVFTIERAVDKRVGSYWRGRLLSIAGATEFGDQKAEKISGLETPDPYTVKITLAAPDSTFLLTIGNFAGMGILPAHVLKDIAPDQLSKHSFGLSPTTSAGVFQFVKYETDQFVEIKRNETYGGTKAKLDRIFAKNLTPDVALAQLDKGEIDLMIVPVAEIERVKRNTNLTVMSVPSPSVSFMCLNNELPFFQDKRVRQAMQWAIDREAIVKEIYKGEATVVNQTIIGPEWMGMPELNMYKFDPNKAKQLLKDAGWDTNRKIETIYTPGNKEQDAFAPIIQQQLKDVGVQIDLRVLEAAEYGRKLVQQHQYEIAFVGGGVFRQDPNVSANYFEKINWTPAGGNYAHYSNPKVDELFRAGRATPDRAERKKIYTELATILNDECPWIYLWSPNSIFGVTKRLQGFKPPSYSTHQVWNAEEWSVTS